MKLFTIGDSISQGFMSNAAARTDLSYSTLLAKAFGLKPDCRNTNGANYFYPEWKAHGVKQNIEAILRHLETKYGSNITRSQWLSTRPLQSISSVLQRSKHYYEQGEGAADRSYHHSDIDYFHNVAIQGFSIADAWAVKPSLCEKQIAKVNQRQQPKGDFLKWVGNAVLQKIFPERQGANAAFHRIALKVLEPNLECPKNYSQMDWLEFHAKNEGVENLLLWLGNNNALGTVLDFKIRQTPNDPDILVHKLSQPERWEKGWNLWHPRDFELEYAELLDRVDSRMENNQYADWKVFLGTIPMVTVIPFAKGVGETTEVKRGDETWIYYEYYTYFPFEAEFAIQTGKYLTMQDVIHIDDCILEYNKTIQKLVDEKNQQHGQQRYFIVHLSQHFSELAYKRNNGKPTYKFPDDFHFRYPPVNTKYYHADERGNLKQGGIFSLDGVHPSAITQGLIAHEFLKTLRYAGVHPIAELNWAEIFASDTLYTQPIKIMQEIYRKDWLAMRLIKFVEQFRQTPQEEPSLP
ncbi:hypothetical protein C7B76_17785 [filamentous cyanobacterium CCP2]|nr:hypothetical protein C7B76_17785 [filamentous cyanobacterium CCP2]